MGVMVSSSDYEPEAFKLSAEYSVALMDWETVNSISEDKLAATFKPARLIYNFRFVPEHNAPHFAFPEEPALLRFLMQEIRIEGPGIDTCPEELVKRHYEQAIQDAVCRPKDYLVALPPGTVFVHPNSQTRVRIKAFSFTYQIIPQAEVRDLEAVFEDHYGVTKKSLQQEMLKRNGGLIRRKLETDSTPSCDPPNTITTLSYNFPITAKRFLRAKLESFWWTHIRTAI